MNLPPYIHIWQAPHDAPLHPRAWRYTCDHHGTPLIRSTNHAVVEAAARAHLNDAHPGWDLDAVEAHTSDPDLLRLVSELRQARARLAELPDPATARPEQVIAHLRRTYPPDVLDAVRTQIITAHQKETGDSQ